MPPPNRIVTRLWHCHDGWACSVDFIVGGKASDEFDLQARRLWAETFDSSWYRSSTSKAAAEKKLARKVTIAREIFSAPVTEGKD